MTASRSIFADEPSVKEVMPLFLKRIPTYMEQLNSSIQAKDYDAIARHCHQFKGSALSFGFPVLSELLNVIEDEAKQQASPEEINAVKEPLETLVLRILQSN